MVIEFFHTGAIEIQDPCDMRRFEVNGQWLKNYYGGEIPSETTSLILSDY